MPDRSRALDYLASLPHPPWRWSDDGEAVIWEDGSTIAFREELKVVLGTLSPGGLPPFRSVILLLAACRGDGDELRQWLPASRVDEAVRRGLHEIMSLSTEERTRIEGKCVLAEMIFGKSERRIDGALARAVLEPLGDRMVPLALPPSHPLRDDDGDWGGDLGPGVEAFDPDAFRTRLRTGLEFIPEPASVAMPPCQEVRRLLRELGREETHAGLARLARNLMAVTALPRNLSTPDDVSVGGISDLANRGPLDRILVSELAHDDATLATRIALNEALYLRREAPPRTPPEARALLLDCGVRLWGVSRVFGTAVALAFAATGDPRREVLVWRAHGEAIEEADLTSHQGLLTHLERTTPDPDPIPALGSFLKMCESIEGGADAILVTHERVLDDEAFREARQALFQGTRRDDRLYVATVSGRGRYRLHTVSGHGSRVLQEALLDLSDISREDAAPLTAGDPSGLPVVLESGSFPLRVPHVVDVSRARWSSSWGAVTVTEDGRLTVWDERGRGPRQLYGRVFSGRVLWLSAEPERIRLLTASPEGEEVQGIVFEGGGHTREFRTSVPELPRGALWPEEVPFLIHDDGIRLGMPGPTGAPLVVPPARARWVSGRFFESRTGSWFALRPHGAEARFEAVPLPSEMRDVVHVFEQEEAAGPWFVGSDGIVDGLSPIAFRPRLDTPVRKVEVSHDGHRVIIEEASGRRVLVDLERGTEKVVESPTERLLEPSIVERVQLANALQSRFESIATDGGGLHLLRGRGSALSLSWGEGCFRWRRPAGADPSRFQDVESTTDAGSGLRVARLGRGVTAYLDSRGLLHLKGIDSDSGELSLVLAEGGLTGWSTSLGGFGDPFFVDPGPETVLARVLEGLRTMAESAP